MSYRMIFILLFTSFIICEETITQVTEIFPGGRPKEITIYRIDEKSSDFSLIPSTRYIYNPNGELHKYQEWWINGKKSKEVLIQRDQIIERNSSNKGFSEDTYKFNIDDYSIPPINSTRSGSKTTLSSLLSDFEKTKYDLNNLSSIVEELIYEMNLFKNKELEPPECFSVGSKSDKKYMMFSKKYIRFSKIYDVFKKIYLVLKKILGFQKKC